MHRRCIWSWVHDLLCIPPHWEETPSSHGASSANNPNTKLRTHVLLLSLTDVEVSRRPHLPVFGDDIDDQRVAHQTHQHDEGEQEGHQPGVGEEGVLVPVLLFLVVVAPASSQREVHPLRAVEPDLLGGVPRLLGGEHSDRMAARDGVREWVLGRRSGVWEEWSTGIRRESVQEVHTDSCLPSG